MKQKTPPISREQRKAEYQRHRSKFCAVHVTIKSAEKVKAIKEKHGGILWQHYDAIIDAGIKALYPKTK